MLILTIVLINNAIYWQNTYSTQYCIIIHRKKGNAYLTGNDSDNVKKKKKKMAK